VLAEHTGDTFEALAAARGLPLSLLSATREALGFARPPAGEPVRQDDQRVAAFVELAREAGLGESAVLQLLRVYGDNLARIAEAEGAVYRRSFVEPLRASGEDASRSMQLASELAGRPPGRRLLRQNREPRRAHRRSSGAQRGPRHRGGSRRLGGRRPSLPRRRRRHPQGVRAPRPALQRPPGAGLRRGGPAPSQVLRRRRAM
jgi:hypothetical protein